MSSMSSISSMSSMSFEEKERCMICLEDCDNYIELTYCKCRNISHEKCFKDYIYIDGKLIIKCLICKQIYDYEYALKYISSNPFINTLFYGLFIALQNLYFIVDDKIFPQHLTILRTSSAVLFHIFLTIALIMPYIILLYINYAFFMCRKPYKIFTIKNEK